MILWKDIFISLTERIELENTYGRRGAFGVALARRTSSNRTRYYIGDGPPLGAGGAGTGGGTKIEVQRTI
jgi:hypothetical protein